MAGETSMIWKTLYWMVIVIGVFIILASYFPGVSGNPGSPQPKITSPASGAVYQVVAGSQFTLTCQVSPTLPGGERVTGMLHLWWCGSNSDPSCYETLAPLNATTSTPLWAVHTSWNVTTTDSTDLALSLTEESVDREAAAGRYFCAAWAEGSGRSPRSANITVEITDPVPVPTTDPSPGTTMKTTSAPTAAPSARPSQSDPTASPDRNGTTAVPPGSKDSSAAVITAVVIVVVVAIIAVIIAIWFCKSRKQACCKGHRVRARQSNKHDSFTSDGGLSGFGMTPVQGELQPFITRHRCDVFIHHHGTDLTLAEMMRSKLLDQESHLHVTLWSEVAGTGRESRPSTKRLALSLVHSTTVVLLVSWKYLQHESQRFRLALSRIPRKIDAVRHKVVIVRRIEEDRVPQDLKADVAQALEYNVDTDSKFFWPRFSRAVVPARDDMLYWRT